MVYRVLGIIFILFGIVALFLKDKQLEKHLRIYYDKGYSEEKLTRMRGVFNARLILFAFLVFMVGILFLFFVPNW